MAELNTGALLDFAGVLDSGRENKGGARVAVVARIGADGTVYVSLPGGVDETPIATSGASLNIGDVVNVSIEGGKLRAIANITDPSASSAELRSTARTANNANTTAINAAETAREADRLANATNQHFWSDDSGVHVTEAENDATTEHNILINSLGILLRKATNYLVSLTQSAIAFYDGLGNAAGNIVAQFGASGAQIGMSGKSHMELDFHSLKLIDKNGNKYLHVSDLRESDGIAEINDVLSGDNTRKRFSLSYPATDSNYQVVVKDANGNDVTSNYSISEKNTALVVFQTAIPSDCTVAATYDTESYMAKAYTLGIRNSSAVVGPMSFAEGYNTKSSETASHAEGYSTEASGKYSHSEGRSTTASMWAAHAEGEQTIASGNSSHAEGRMTTASGRYSHAECDDTLASGWSSHAEGSSTTASELSSHAEGMSTTASGVSSHAEGAYTTAAGISSHAEGYDARAAGFYSHAQNEGTYTGRYAQTAIGTYNVKDWDDPDASEPPPPTTHPSGGDEYGQYALIIGNGTADNARSNALTADWSGSAQLWNPDIERGTAPSSSIYGGGGTLQLVDKDGHQIGYLQPTQLSDGTEGIQLGVSNSDSTDYNTLQLAFDSNDNPTVSVSDADKWRNALGITDSGWKTLTLGSAAKAYDSGTAPVYRKCFNVVNIVGAVSPKSQVAAGGEFDVGVLPTGYRPKVAASTVCQGSGNSVYLLRIGTNGNIRVERYRNGASVNAAISTTTWLPFNVTFICA